MNIKEQKDKAGFPSADEMLDTYKIPTEGMVREYRSYCENLAQSDPSLEGKTGDDMASESGVPTEEKIILTTPKTDVEALLKQGYMEAGEFFRKLENGELNNQSRMNKSRKEIITEQWNSIHGRFVPMFRWRNHENMRYQYDEQNDCIKADCGISIPIDVPTNQINKMSLRKVIRQLEYKVYREYKIKYDIDLGIDD